MRQRPHSTGWPKGCQSSWSRVPEAQPTPRVPTAARLSHPIAPGPVIRAENCWAWGGQQPGTCFCAAQLPALGDFGAASAECSSDGSRDPQRFSRYSAMHKLRRGLVTLSVRCFSGYTMIFSLCVCVYV